MSINVDRIELENNESWWNPSIDRVANISFAEAADNVRDLFLESIRLHMRSDVPLGCALSGGIDSSSIACAIRYLYPNKNINTFSYLADTAQLNEKKWIDLVCNHINATPHFIKPNAGDIIYDLDYLIRCQGEPFGSTSIYAQYLLFKKVKEVGVVTTLDGQGADEILGGYLGYPAQKLQSLILNKKYNSIIPFLKGWSEQTGLKKRVALQYYINYVTNPSLNSKLRRLTEYSNYLPWLNYSEFDVVHEKEQHAKVLSEQRRPLVSSLRSALRGATGLTHLLRHADRNSMASSIESRVPFLDTQFTEYMLSLPEEYLVSDRGVSKYIFRIAMKGIVPPEILNRKDKIGFETPQNKFLDELMGEENDILEIAREIRFIDTDEVKKSFTKAVNLSNKRSNRQWRLINFIKWYQHSELIAKRLISVEPEGIGNNKV